MALVSGTETRVNSYTTNDQTNQQITALTDGGWVVTWQSLGQDGSGYGVYQQAYNANGTTRGTEARVNTYTTNGQLNPQVTAIEDGGWVVTWVSDGQDGSNHGVFQQAYDASGTTRGAETQVNSYTSGFQNSQQVTALNDGGWVVTWRSNDFSEGSINQQAYNANGTARGNETLVNTHTVNDQANPQICGLADGGWVVTWQSAYQDGSYLGVYQQAFNSDGTARGSEMRVNSYTTNSQSQQKVTALADGGWVVTWVSDGQDGSGYGVYQQAYDSSGTALGDEARVNTYTTQSQDNQQVTALADGGWVVTWMSIGQDGSSFGISQQAYDANGSAQGAETTVNSYTGSDQMYPQITALAHGGWVVTWESYGQEGPSYGVYQQAFDASGIARGPETRVNTYTTNEQTNQQITALADGGWVVTWRSYGQDGSGLGIYQKKFYFPNEAPSGTDKTITINEDVSHTFAVSDFGFSDADGGTFVSIKIDSLPEHGTLTLNGSPVQVSQTITVSEIPSLVWTPGANENGTGYAAFTFRVVDDGNTDNGGAYIDPVANTITFDVTPVADAPELTGQPTSFGEGTEDTSYTVFGSELLAGYTDADGDTLIVEGVASPQAVVTDNQDGSFTITPQANFSGTLTLFYLVNDQNGHILPGHVDIQFAGVNDAPGLTGEKAQLAEGTEDTAYTISASDLLTGYTDADGDTMSVRIDSCNHGTVVDNKDGTFTITPEADYAGPVSIVYFVSDGKGAITVANQTFDLASSNDLPTLTGTQATLADGVAGEPYIVSAADLLAGYTDAEGDSIIVQNLASDVATITDNQDGTYTITPDDGYTGEVELSYLVADGSGSGTPATISFMLEAANVAPELTGDKVRLFPGVEDTPYSVSATELLAGFTDANGDTLSVESLTAINGTVTDNHDGSFTIMPEANFKGPMLLSYTVSDGKGGSVVADHVVFFEPVNDAPQVGSTIAGQAATEDSAFSFTVDAGAFTDIDGDTLTWSANLSNGGALPDWLSFDEATRTFSGTPGNDAVGVTGIKVTVQDGNKLMASQVFDITVSNVNDAPEAAADASVTAAENIDKGTLIATAGATDPDANDVLSFAIQAGNDDGLFEIDPATGEITLATGKTLDRESAAAYVLTIRVSDAAGAFDDQAITINVGDVDEFDVGIVTDKDGSPGATVAEDLRIGSKIGLVAIASDGDATNDAITYSLDNNAGGRFAINAVNGLVTLASALDYETATSHIVSVRATSADGSFSVTNFTVTVTDVAENLPGANDRANNLAGDDTANTGSLMGGSDTYEAKGGNDVIYGGEGNDNLYGDYKRERSSNPFGDDKLYGENGNDSLYGSYGNDTLDGGNGTDTLEGGDGDDDLTGGQGVDSLKGGRGQDDFIFDDFDTGATRTTRDKITDFARNDKDRIDLSLIDAIAATPGDDALVLYTGATAAAQALATPGGAYIEQLSRTEFRIHINTSTAAGFEMEIDVTAPSGLLASDLIL